MSPDSPEDSASLGPSRQVHIGLQRAHAGLLHAHRARALGGKAVETSKRRTLGSNGHCSNQYSGAYCHWKLCSFIPQDPENPRFLPVEGKKGKAGRAGRRRKRNSAKPAMACFKMGNLPWNVCTSQLRSWATPKNHLRKAGALFTLMLNPAPKRGTVAFEWYHQTHCTVDSLNQRNTTANRVQSSWPTAK